MARTDGATTSAKTAARKPRRQAAIDQPPPGDTTSERALIGSLLIDPQLADSAAAIIRESDFTDPMAGAAYKAIIEAAAEGHGFDAAAIVGRIKAKPGGESAVADLLGIMADQPSAAAWRYHAERVADRGLRRRLWQVAFDAIGDAHNCKATRESLASLLGQLAELNRVADAALNQGVHAADLLRRELPMVRYIVDRYVPEGLTLVSGPPKIGKSWLALGAFCIPVATGGIALGGLAVDPGPVLYLALEDNLRRLKSRLEKLLGDEEPAGLKLLRLEIAWPRIGDGAIERMDRWVRDNQGARLIVVDTLAKVRSPRDRYGNPYQEDYAVVSAMKELADTHSIGVVVLTHNRQAAATDQLEQVSGTSGLTGAADSILVLKRDRGQHDATLFVTGRDVAEAELAMQFHPDCGQWSILGAAEEYRMSKQAQATVSALGELAVASTPLTLSKHLGEKDTTIRVRLGKMAKRGEVIANGDGTYSLPQWVPLTR